MSQSVPLETIVSWAHKSLERGVRIIQTQDEYCSLVDVALYLYDEIIELGIADPTTLLFVHINRGVANTCLGHLEDALDDFDKALSLGSKDSEVLEKVYENIGEVSMKMEDYDKAETAYTRLIELNPSDPKKKEKAHIERSYAYEQLGRFSEAIKDYSLMIELDPHKPDFYPLRARAYRLSQMYDEAFGDCDRAMQLSNHHPGLKIEAIIERARIYFDKNHIEESLKIFEEEIREHPTNPELYWARSELYGQLGRVNESESDFNTALRLRLQKCVQ